MHSEAICCFEQQVGNTIYSIGKEKLGKNSALILIRKRQSPISESFITNTLISDFLVIHLI